MKKENTEISAKNYSKILAEIQKQIAATQGKIIKSITRQKVEMAWQIGKIIEEHLLENNEKSYGKQLMAQLERDVKIAESTLYKMQKFYKAYKKLPKNDDRLNWSHYRVLAGIKKQEERKYLQEMTLQNGWDSHQLQLEVSKNKDEQQVVAPAKTKASRASAVKNKKTKISTSRGKLFNYRVAKIPGSKDFFLDCGFGIFRKIEEKLPRNLRSEGAIVVTQKNKNYQIKKSFTSPKQLHCYKAWLNRVVDGDTIHVVLDLGFNIFHSEILRLRAVNAAELSTAQGKKSSAILSEILRGQKFLVVKTNKTDIYGRYVADVFLAEKKLDDLQKIAERGIFLNQLLLDRKAVEIY